MALMVFYDRIREDPTEVEYRFGTREEHLDQRLIIDKQARTFRDQDDRTQGITRAVASRIFGRYRAEGTWPVRGMIQA